MKPIYIVYEINEHNSLNTFILKVLNTNKKIASDFYKSHKKDYKKDYRLVLASCFQMDFSIESNLMRDFTTLKNSF